jgi:hypothetical protein
MNRALRVLFAAMAVVFFVRGTCGKPKPAHVEPVQKMKIADEVKYHNMGIAWDGDGYWTVNGGNEDYSVVNQYDRNGELQETYDFSLDGRAIGYSAAEDRVMVKPYGTDLVWLDPDIEDTELAEEDMFSNEQSSVAFSPDGKFAYEFDGGDVTVYSTASGEDVSDFEIENYYDEESGGFAFSIAVSDKFLFAWKAENEIYVYDLSGKYVTSFELPRAGFGFSLSYCNGMLWIASDADGGSDGATGTWYGYELRGLE